MEKIHLWSIFQMKLYITRFVAHYYYYRRWWPFVVFPHVVVDSATSMEVDFPLVLDRLAIHLLPAHGRDDDRVRCRDHGHDRNVCGVRNHDVRYHDGMHCTGRAHRSFQYQGYWNSQSDSRNHQLE